MLSLGVDPGSRWTACTILKVPREGRARYIATIVIDVADGVDRAVVAVERLAKLYEPDVLAVERVDEVHATIGRFDGRRATELVRAAWVGGRVADRLSGYGRVATFSAAEWRRHWIEPVSPKERSVRKSQGERVDTDKVVKALVEQLVQGWPGKILGIKAKEMCHARDACCVALFGAYLAKQEQQHGQA